MSANGESSLSNPETVEEKPVKDRKVTVDMSANGESSLSNPETVEEKPVEDGKGKFTKVTVDMSANGENSQSNPETVEEKQVENGKVKEIHQRNVDVKISIENGSEQNQEEGNLSTENIIEDFFSIVDNQRKELQIIEKHLSETIQKLEMSLRENRDTSESVKKTLMEHIEKGMILQREIKITLSDRESREKSMRFQLAKFRESLPLKDSEASADGHGNNVVKTEQGSFTPQTVTDSEELDESSDEDLRHLELNFVKTILKAAKIRQKMAETEDFNEQGKSKYAGIFEEEE